MTQLQVENEKDQQLSAHEDCIVSWESACTRLLDAVDEQLRPAVQRILECRHGGLGLRDWVSAIAYRRARLPDHIPAALIEVYLHDPEAVPLHDCEDCGVAVPVRPNRVYGMESDPEQQYFSACPVCGGRTGPYYFWSRPAPFATTAIRRRKPR